MSREANCSRVLVERISERKHDIFRGIESNNGQISKYIFVLDQLRRVNVATDREFQTTYNSFYRMQRRSKEYYRKYFLMLESVKHGTPNFVEIIRELYSTLSRIEPSFASKMAATIDPSLPVYDKHVLINLGLKPHYLKAGLAADKKLAYAIENYAKISEIIGEIILSNNRISELLESFSARFTEYMKLTSIKKLDLMIWQLRERPS